MKKIVLFLAFLLVVSIGGCSKNEDLSATITQGTWRVDYFIADGDEDTDLFNGYVFTFMADRTVLVIRPGLPNTKGTWEESDSDTRLELNFSDTGLLRKLDETWVVNRVLDDELRMNKLYTPSTQLRFAQR